MNVAITEQDRDFDAFMLYASNACILSTKALEWNLVTSAISAPYRCGIAAEVSLSIISITC